jgi:hypothetical protein
MLHPTIKRVAIDLDDTSNSLTMFILAKRFGIDVGPYDYDRFPAEVGYDILGAYEKLKKPGQPVYDIPGFWNEVKREDWASAPKSREFNMILEHALESVKQEDIFILTTPTKDPDSLAGKLEWIHNNYPPFLHRQYLVGPRKHFCARPDTLLIDDSDDQVNKFREHGGYAVLVPRPWNSLHFLDTFRHMNEQLSFYLPRRAT